MQFFIFAYYINPDFFHLLLLFLDGDLTCNSTHMQLKLNKTALEDRNSVFKISFQDESDNECVIFNSNATTQDASFIWIESELKSCGIKQRIDEQNIIFNQTIIIQYGSNPSGGLIYREEFDSYDVNCKVSRNETAEVSIGTVIETSLTFKKSKICCCCKLLHDRQSILLFLSLPPY